MESYKVIWDNREVGQLIDPRPDMWYLEGDWKSNGTSDSARFEKILKSLDTRQVMIDLSKGPEIILRTKGSDNLDAIGISLNNDKLFVRRMTEKLSESRRTRKGLFHRLLKFFGAK
jgi:hypothetical protein